MLIAAERRKALLAVDLWRGDASFAVETLRACVEAPKRLNLLKRRTSDGNRYTLFRQVL
ncbi:hypothetical protein [Sinorhizobium sp. 22678]|uniref:hypothetical protein n=1 Tax=Sinorhizobium sp. 22678 TaxID=3453955 RepID=UPI003F82A6BC